MVICLTKYLLGEKHQLSKIWLAAHWEKKIKRTQIFEVDIEKSVQDIMEAEIILDLRLSGHLLVGIVKIHSKKTKYLLTECSSIFYQVKIFHASRIDLPYNKQTAALKEITLTEYFSDNLDNIGSDIIDAILSSNQSRMEDITLKETATERLALLDEDDITNFVFHEEDEPLDFPTENMMSIYNDLEISKDLPVEQSKVVELNGTVTTDQNKTTVYSQVDNLSSNIEKQERSNGVAVPSDIDAFAAEVLNSDNSINEIPEDINLTTFMNEDVDHTSTTNSENDPILVNSRNFDKLKLEPLKFLSRNLTKIKTRKRKLSIDYIKCLSEEEIKKQVWNTSDIMSVLDMAPSTKRMMVLKEIGHSEMLFCLPVIKFQNPKLLKLYQQNLKTHPCDDFDSLQEEEESIVIPRKKSRSEILIDCQTNENVSNSLDDSSELNVGNNANVNTENDFPVFEDNLNFNTEVTDGFFESRVQNILLPENLVCGTFQTNDVQSTPASRTSAEKWEYALQGRIIQMLLALKQSFEENSVILFSNFIQKNRKLLVAQKFLCLLMLKKFRVISLEQRQSYGEIFVSQDLNFESACFKFCSS